MPAYGRNHYPRTYGGGKTFQEIEHAALLVATKNVLKGDQHDDEAYAEATGIAILWAATERASNQMIPERMLDQLRVWEQALSLRPGPKDSAIARRRKVASKLRGLANSALSDIEEASRKVLGDAFVTLHKAPPPHIVYWGGVNPGPPGMTWSSNRARICIEIDKSRLGDAEFFRLRSDLVTTLDAMLPAWMTFCVGASSSFPVNIGIVGQTII